jgi:hypothetical protein
MIFKRKPPVDSGYYYAMFIEYNYKAIKNLKELGKIDAKMFRLSRKVEIVKLIKLHDIENRFFRIGQGGFGFFPSDFIFGDKIELPEVI